MIEMNGPSQFGVFSRVNVLLFLLSVEDFNPSKIFPSVFFSLHLRFYQTIFFSHLSFSERYFIFIILAGVL